MFGHFLFHFIGSGYTGYRKIMQNRVRILIFYSVKATSITIIVDAKLLQILIYFQYMISFNHISLTMCTGELKF